MPVAAKGGQGTIMALKLKLLRTAPQSKQRSERAIRLADRVLKERLCDASQVERALALSKSDLRRPPLARRRPALAIETDGHRS